MCMCKESSNASISWDTSLNLREFVCIPKTQQSVFHLVGANAVKPCWMNESKPLAANCQIDWPPMRKLPLISFLKPTSICWFFVQLLFTQMSSLPDYSRSTVCLVSSSAFTLVYLEHSLVPMAPYPHGPGKMPLKHSIILIHVWSWAQRSTPCSLATMAITWKLYFSPGNSTRLIHWPNKVSE